MANLARIKEIQARFAGRATFLTVYTQGECQVSVATGYLTRSGYYRGTPY